MKMISVNKGLHYRCSAAVLLSLLAGANGAIGDVVWTDDFASSSLNTDYWGYDLGDGINGWGNEQLEVYTNSTSNVNVTGGQLWITAIRGADGNSFTSGRIKTENKFEFLYGRLEASIKVPNVADGLWPAFWIMGWDFSDVGWPAAGEVDIMELGQGQAIVDGVVNQRVISGAHWEHNGGYATYATSLNTSQDLYLGFHNYTLDWTPTTMATYVDGQLIWKMDITESVCTDCTEFHQPYFILLNLAVGGYFTTVGSDGSSGATGSSSAGCTGSSSSGGCGTPRSEVTAPLPATMYVDYVRLVDNGYTQIITPTPATPAPADNIFDGRSPTPAPVVGAESAPTPAPVVGAESAPTPVPTTGAAMAPTPAPVASLGTPTEPPFSFASTPAPVSSAPVGDSEVDCVSSATTTSGKSGSGKGGGKGGDRRRHRRTRGRRLCTDTASSKGGSSKKKGKGEGSTSAQSFESAVSAAPAISDLYTNRLLLIHPILVAMGVLALGL